MRRCSFHINLYVEFKYMCFIHDFLVLVKFNSSGGVVSDGCVGGRGGLVEAGEMYWRERAMGGMAGERKVETGYITGV